MPFRRAAPLALLLAAAACAKGPAPTPDPVEPIAVAKGPIDGRTSFDQHCVNCHGPEGRGNGPLANILNIAVPDLGLLAARNGGTFPADAVRRTIDGTEENPGHGYRLMPVWGLVLDPMRSVDADREEAIRHIDAIVAHVETLQRPD